MTMKSLLLATSSILAALALTLPAKADPIVVRALMEDVPETQIIEAMLPEFQKETGILVEFEKLAYGDMHDKLVTQLTGASSAYTVLEVDFLWAGEFPAAGWLTELTPLVEKSKFDVSPFIPSMLELVGRSKGGLYLIPMYNYSMGMIYRTDLLKDPKLAEAWKTESKGDLQPPRTLADYVALSKFMKAKAGIAGAAMQGQRGDPNSMEFSNYLFSAGGSYLDDAGKVSLDSPAGKTALDLYIDNVKNGAQQGALSATLDDTQRLMCDGKAVQHDHLLVDAAADRRCQEMSDRRRQGGAHGDAGRPWRKRWLGLGYSQERRGADPRRRLDLHPVGAEQEDFRRSRARRPCAGPLGCLQGPDRSGEVPELHDRRTGRGERQALPDLRLLGAVRGCARHPAFAGRRRPSRLCHRAESGSAGPRRPHEKGEVGRLSRGPRGEPWR